MTLDRQIETDYRARVFTHKRQCMARVWVLRSRMYRYNKNGRLKIEFNKCRGRKPEKLYFGMPEITDAL